MIVVPARKEQEYITLERLSDGDAFRQHSDSDLYVRSHVVCRDEVSCFNLYRGRLTIVHSSKSVIPARVILVEKGADLKDVAEALEKL